MKNKTKLLTLAIAGIIAVSAIGAGTLAFFTDNDKNQNVITMGDVDIDLEEPNYPGGPDGGEITDVMPNAKIVKDPTITLQEESNDAYVRANIKISANKAGTPFTLTAADIDALYASLDIDNKVWYVDATDAANGTYVAYYKDMLTHGREDVKPNKSVKLFTEVTIPSTWNNAYSGISVVIDVTAEAIQADNFKPTIENGLITSWGDVTIESK